MDFYGVFVKAAGPAQNRRRQVKNDVFLTIGGQTGTLLI